MTRWTAILLLVGCLHVSAKGLAQHITLKEKNTPLPAVLKSIQKQSGFSIIYRDEWMKNAKPVSVDITANTLEDALKACLRNQPFTFKIIENTILLHPKRVEKAPKSAIISVAPQPEPLRGRVTDTAGNPLEGVSVFVKGTKYGTVTDKDGYFKLDVENYTNKELAVSFIGYKPRTISLSNQQVIDIMLQLSDNKLDDIVTQAYGTTTQRLTTGSIGTVTAKEIEKQPIANPLAALVGRVPGLTVIQSSGIPGAAFKVQIRGRTSINKNISNDPLFIIDGIPFANNNDAINSIGSALTSNGKMGLSPFNLIDPTQIESISVLKDADATSIYGSRGANGVVLITTKRGKAGKTEMSANFYTGVSSVPEKMPLMNTQQYLAMRHEAFTNDDVIPTSGNAPDLFLWDTTRYTDWQNYLTGNTSHTTDANLSFSGGNAQTQFLVGGGYHRETTVFPGNLHDGRGSLHFNIKHQSQDKKFNLNFSGNFSQDVNHLNVSDLTQYTFILPPNNPPLYTSEGQLNFSENGYSFDNPLSYLFQPYTSKADNYLGNLLISYKLAKGLAIKSNFGFNGIYVDETRSKPILSQNPMYHPTGAAIFSNGSYKSMIVEPQIEYNSIIGPGKLNAIIGGTWQNNTGSSLYIDGSGYTNDLLLNSISGAVKINSKSNSSTQYKYAAVFGRLNYNIYDTYILNLSARRDGSSRFGPGKQYANFWSIGMAWLFSNERFIKENLPFISFGKLRGSYGTSGNDKIGDYQYLDTWTVYSQTYLNSSGLYPTRLFNPDYAWELNKKLEVALELGIIDDRITLSSGYYRNRSSNQLILYALPTQTGYNSVTQNFPATVQNSGWEFTLSTTNIQTHTFSWKTNFNLTIPKNKLLAFPDLESSSYYRSAIIGESINIGTGLKVHGVNSETGVFDILDKDGKIAASPSSKDKILGLFNNDPKMYGGIGNDLSFKQFSLSLFFDYKKQTGPNYYGNVLQNWIYPGMAFNFPINVLNRWTENNKSATIQKFTTTTSSAAYKAANALRLYNSDILNTDASYIRLRNISLSYNLSERAARKVKAKSCRLFINVQNLFVISNYDGADPNIMNIYTLPQLRTIVGGLSITF